MAAHKLAAVFENRRDLELALKALQEAGYTVQEVSLLLKQSEADKHFVQEDGLLDRTVAEPLHTVVKRDTLTGASLSEALDPVALSEPVSEADAMIADTTPGGHPLPSGAVSQPALTPVRDLSVPVRAPEAALKDPNALVQDAALGGLLGLLAGTAFLMIPGLGPVLALGPIAAGLASLAGTAALGATLGTIAGLLKDVGIPADRVAEYRDAFESGQAIILLTPRDSTLLPSAQALLADLNPVHLELLEV